MKKHVFCAKQIRKILKLSIEVVFSESENPAIVWHYEECRPNFMSTSKLNHYTDKIAHNDINIRDTDNVNNAHSSTLSSRMFLRSRAVEYNPKTHSVICRTGEKNGSMSLVMTDSIHNKLQNMALCDFQLMAKISSS